MNVNITLEGLTLKAESTKLKNGTFLVEGKLKGDVEVECIKCLKPFKKHIEEDVKFKIVKPLYKGFDEDYDVIEMEKYDSKEILKSELESIKNDYNVCEECNSQEFNKEF